MKKKSLLASAMLTIAVSGCDEDALLVTQETESIGIEQAQSAFQVTSSKACALAKLFTPQQDQIPQENTNKSVIASGDITSVSYYIDNGDTLLFAFNYGDESGYTIIGGSLGAFPIIAQSDAGSVNFGNLQESNPFYCYIHSVAEQIKLTRTSPTDTTYAALWADIDNEEYTYDIQLINSADDINNSVNKSRTTIPSNKATIYPHTGIALKGWSQSGDYNSASPNGACIGCPAVAIGMLLYDINNRTDGINEDTDPYFPYQYQNTSYAKSVSSNLKKIADRIPNYQWGNKEGEESGATGVGIIKGLRNLGFSNAQMEDFDFEKAYQNMCRSGKDYFGKDCTYHRGILIAGRATSGVGHIWFCDGYYEQALQITKTRKKLFRKKVTKWIEYENRLYMNWGWGGKQNGWFAADASVSLDKVSFGELKIITGLNTYASK